MEDFDYDNNTSIQGDMIVVPGVKYPRNYRVHAILKQQAKRQDERHRELEINPKPKKEITLSEALKRDEANNEANRLYLERKQEIRERVKAFHDLDEPSIDYTWDRSTDKIERRKKATEIQTPARHPAVIQWKQTLSTTL